MCQQGCQIKTISCRMSDFPIESSASESALSTRLSHIEICKRLENFPSSPLYPESTGLKQRSDQTIHNSSNDIRSTLLLQIFRGSSGLFFRGVRRYHIKYATKDLVWWSICDVTWKCNIESRWFENDSLASRMEKSMKLVYAHPGTALVGTTVM